MSRFGFLIVASVMMSLVAGGIEASSPSGGIGGGVLVRHTRGGPSDGCGPNPLARLAQLVNTITGESMTTEDMSWHLQKDPYMMQEMLALLQFRQYHNCMTTGEGARF